MEEKNQAQNRQDQKPANDRASNPGNHDGKNHQNYHKKNNKNKRRNHHHKNKNGAPNQAAQAENNPESAAILTADTEVKEALSDIAMEADMTAEESASSEAQTADKVEKSDVMVDVVGIRFKASGKAALE